ncbi:hypothetical protein IG631_22375 [Alternaria alternata]|nr:hypothetical protein IG631_22375 [Alternaria alternata]
MKLTVLVLAAVATVAFAGGGSKKNDDALCAACRDVYMPCKHLIITAFVLSASNLSGYPNIESVISLFRAIPTAILARYCLNHLSQPRFDR